MFFCTWILLWIIFGWVCCILKFGFLIWTSLERVGWECRGSMMSNSGSYGNWFWTDPEIGHVFNLFENSMKWRFLAGVLFWSCFSCSWVLFIWCLRKLASGCYGQVRLICGLCCRVIFKCRKIKWTGRGHCTRGGSSDQCVFPSIEPQPI